MAQELQKIRGEVEEITYSNELNGYTVAVVNVDGEMLTVVGEMPFLAAGETITAVGSFTLHKTFGRQFKVEHFEKELPTTEDAIITYLSSGAVKGIGPVSAVRIVQKYGEDTLEVLSEHPEYLADIKGISLKKAREIGESFASQFGIRNVMMYFSGMLPASVAMKLYKRYGAVAVDIVKRNPYVLCEEIGGVGFERADSVAKQLGIDPESHFRIESGIKYILKNHLFKNGNMYLPHEMLVGEAQRVLGVAESLVNTAVSSLGAIGELVVVKFGDTVAVYLASAFEAEKFCASKLRMLSQCGVNIPIKKAERLIETAQLEMQMEFAPLQREAIRASVDSSMLIVTGGPGTGKTTVIRAILKLYDSLGLDTLLAAPTGRAAKRMTEATGREARTIHRLLESGYSEEEGEGYFAKDEDNPLDCHALIVDEISMCDTFLLASLLRAVKPGTKLIFLGDSDQLPPVGPGDALRDMIGSDAIRTVRLSDIFRQSEHSMIVVGAHSINGGRMPPLDNKNEDLFFLPCDDGESFCDLITSLVRDRLPSAYGYDPREDIQVITPSRKGVAGTVSLNKLLQGAVNPGTTARLEKRAGEATFREGDKVMQIKNNYSQEWEYADGRTGKGVFNGEIGEIVSINNFDDIFTVSYEGRLVKYDQIQFDEIEHAYAVTVHKSQGSEYPCVIIPVFDAPPGLLTRNMLYTAITRAVERLILVGRRGVVAEMVKNDRQVKRYTGLCSMLKKGNKE